MPIVLNMNLQKIVIDTNIVISAMLSNRGAAFKLISLIRNQKFKYVLSVPLVLEYEDVLKRKDSKITLSQEAINNILDRLCYHAELRDIFYLWRPFLNDPKDDLVLELAVESNCNSIVTYNLKDFENIDKFGLKAVTPKTFLQQIGVI